MRRKIQGYNGQISEAEYEEILRELTPLNNNVGRDIGRELKERGETDNEKYAEEIFKNKGRLKHK